MAARRAPAARSGFSSSGFVQAVLSRPAPFTIGIIIFCVALYLAMRLTGGGDTPALVAFGAKLNTLVRVGEWWRMVTPIFLHVPMGDFPLHLLVNMYSLWNIGPYVEKLYGSSKFVVIWVVTGIFGVVASYLAVRPGMQVGTVASFLIKTTDTPSAGASGALFGLIGVLIVFGIKYRRELPEGFRKAFGTGLFPVLLVNLGIGFFGRGFIDNAAHLGGLISGIAIALVIDYERPQASALTKNLWRFAQGLALALVAVSFFMVWRHYSTPPKEEAITAFMVNTNKGMRALNTFLLKGDASGLEEAERDLATVPHVSTEADESVRQLRDLLNRGRAIKVPAGDEKVPPAVQEQFDSVARDANNWRVARKRWFEQEGPSYGLFLEKSDQPPIETKK